MPEVTVVLPAFNASGTVQRAVRSILDQSLADLELIVADDGSTDDTVAAVARNDDPRLRIAEYPHRGVAATVNSATRLARAPLIARMDADDVAHPNRLDQQLRLLRDQALDAVGCQVRILNRSGKATESMRRYERWINEETTTPEQIAALRFVELPLVNPTILARRSYFELGFRDNELPEDYDLMLRAAACGMRFGKVARVLFDWIDGPDRLTRSDPRYSAQAFTRCRQTHLRAGPLRDVDQVDLWGIGRTGKPWLRWLQSEGITVRRGYDVNSRKGGVRIHDVPIAHPEILPAADGTPLMIAVGAAGARDVILPQIQSCGYISGRDAWFVA